MVASVSPAKLKQLKATAPSGSSDAVNVTLNFGGSRSTFTAPSGIRSLPRSAPLPQRSGRVGAYNTSSSFTSLLKSPSQNCTEQHRLAALIAVTVPANHG